MRVTRSNRLGVVSVVFAFCGVVACGDSSTGDGGGPGPDPDCTTDADCSSGQVCQPFTQTCEDPGTPCTANAECANGTYCETGSGVCLPSSTGSPCDTADNCEANSECVGGFCGCDGLVEERQLEGGPLDVYMVLDRTGSMGTDCDYTAGTSPPVSSKACFATYALSDYMIGVTPTVDTRLAFHFMSQPNDCDGMPYATPLVPLTRLPVTVNDTLITTISAEDFSGGLGTHIEGALNGIARYTGANVTPGREMIGVLVTDGDPNGCQENINSLATIISDHRTATGLRTFIIGMTGATESNLETLAIAGGADAHDDFCGGITPPCHYWNVGDGSGAAIADALQAIVDQAVPLPCDFDVSNLTAPDGGPVNYGEVNVAIRDGGVVTTIPQVPDAASCPANSPAWYYDDPNAPTTIHLCDNACDIATAAGDGATVSVVAGCTETVVVN